MFGCRLVVVWFLFGCRLGAVWLLLIAETRSHNLHPWDWLSFGSRLVVADTSWLLFGCCLGVGWLLFIADTRSHHLHPWDWCALIIYILGIG